MISTKLKTKSSLHGDRGNARLDIHLTHAHFAHAVFTPVSPRVHHPPVMFSLFRDPPTDELRRVLSEWLASVVGDLVHTRARVPVEVGVDGSKSHSHGTVFHYLSRNTRDVSFWARVWLGCGVNKGQGGTVRALRWTALRRRASNHAWMIARLKLIR